MSTRAKTLFHYIYHDSSICIRDFVLNKIGGGYICPRLLRTAIYKMMGNDVNTNQINAGCFIGGNKLKVGKGTFISYDNFFDLSDNITIGNDVHIAMRCLFITSSHKIGNRYRRAGRIEHKPISIGDGCWIGGNVTILPGVSIGNGTIIAAGAVVTKNCESNSLYAGVPATKIKDLE